MKKINDTSQFEVGDIFPPTHLPSDYVEIAYLSALITIGLPLNIFVFVKLYGQYLAMKGRPRAINLVFLILKINLNISDLLLFVYTIVKISWLSTYEWIGGSWACKFFQFFSVFAFYLSSNSIAIIALDRVWTVFNPLVGLNAAFLMRKLKVSLAIAWLLSLAESVPQFFVWDTVNIFQKSHVEWYQCSDYWTIQRFSTGGEKEEKLEIVYSICHLLAAYWVPTAAIAVSYALIVAKLLQYSCSACTSQSTAATEYSNMHQANLEPLAQSNNQLQLQIQEEPINGERETLQSTTYHVQRIRDPGREPRRWRSQLRSRMFQRTGLVVATHVLLCLPYNLYALVNHLDKNWAEFLNESANYLKSLVILNALINPFLYGINR